MNPAADRRRADDPGSVRSGVLAGLAAYLTWGLIPIYFKALGAVPPVEIVAVRVVGSAVVLAGVVLWQRRLGELGAAVTSWPRLRWLLLSTGLIAVNWLVFVWAVANERVLEASLGYFITPLVSVALGVVVLRERLSRATAVAIALAAVGVGGQLVVVGRLPLVALLLAGSFGTYGLVHKTSRTGAVVGLLAETGLLSPIALGYLGWLHSRDELSFGAVSPTVDALLLVAGIITAAPLLAFSLSARRIPLTMLSFIQYIAPSGQFLLAVLLYGEPLTPVRLFTFACIWTALALFTRDRLRGARRTA